MKLSAHAASSAAVSAAAYAATGSPGLAAAAFAGGVLIDLDHLVDFVVLSGERFSVPGLFSWCEEMRWRRIYLALHSIELLALAALAAAWLRSDVLLGLVLGAGSHLALDQLGNREPVKGQRLSVWFYFLAYRFWVGFRKARLVTGPGPG